VSPTTYKLRSIALVPVGPVHEQSLGVLKERLPKKFAPASCQVIEMDTGFEESFNSRTRQYYATRILAALERHATCVEGEKLLGVTDLDLYVPNMNFVFGEARLPGRVAIISTHRLKDDTRYGDAQLFPVRLIKEAVHELGHTLGLGHCDKPSCVMYFSNSLSDTDRKGEDFCQTCSGKLGRDI
jgi:archaemetzincin